MWPTDPYLFPTGDLLQAAALTFYNPNPFHTTVAPPLGARQALEKCTVTILVGHNNQTLAFVNSRPQRPCSAIGGIACAGGDGGDPDINATLARLGRTMIPDLPGLPTFLYNVNRPSGIGSALDDAA